MSNIFGLNSKKPGDDSDEEKKKQNEYYVGGTDGHGGGSGMAVLGPPGGGGRAPPSSVNDMMSRVVQAASNAGEEDAPGAMNNVITLYSNGFVVNDGPLRDPEANQENREFIESLLKGVAPREFRDQSRNPKEPVNISLSDKRSETYTPPAYVPFSNGTSLGGGAQSDISDMFDPATLPMGPELDNGEASTTIQIKTNNGKKLRLKVNTKITVLQLAALISEQAGQDDAPFTLLAGFPPKELTDRNATVEAAGLKGASLTQK